jgi:hypothetical protein
MALKHLPRYRVSFAARIAAPLLQQLLHKTLQHEMQKAILRRGAIYLTAQTA